MPDCPPRDWRHLIRGLVRCGWPGLMLLVAMAFAWPGGAAEGETLERFRAAHRAMGIEFTLTLYAPDRATADAAFAAAWARIDALNAVMSDYDPESELSRLGRSSPHAESQPVSDDLWRVLQAADRFSRWSGGAFDVTVGPLTRLWRRSKRQLALPDEADLAAARQAVGFEAIEFARGARAIRLAKPNMRLDLGGIGQGFAADEVVKLLCRRGLTRVLLDASGDVVAADAPPGAAGWNVDITGLDPKQPAAQRVVLARGAISTSGDAFQFVQIGGQRYGHIVDPQTGLGLTQRCSVTVRADDGTTADAVATAVCILGPKRGLQLVETLPNVAARVIFVEEGAPLVRQSSRWK